MDVVVVVVVVDVVDVVVVVVVLVLVVVEVVVVVVVVVVEVDVVVVLVVVNSACPAISQTGWAAYNAETSYHSPPLEIAYVPPSASRSPPESSSS